MHSREGERERARMLFTCSGNTLTANTSQTNRRAQTKARHSERAKEIKFWSICWCVVKEQLIPVDDREDIELLWRHFSMGDLEDMLLLGGAV